jgi:hypothetical protein
MFALLNNDPSVRSRKAKLWFNPPDLALYGRKGQSRPFPTKRDLYGYTIDEENSSRRLTQEEIEEYEAFTSDMQEESGILQEPVRTSPFEVDAKETPALPPSTNGEAQTLAAETRAVAIISPGPEPTGTPQPTP